mmetsp:Transcript_25173/g.54721  ORF Transcript_25173/g.54721 Transcript_25173/m.54721 type:complete len:425 (+) Transcript_25173:2-1276(+)
MPSLSTKPSRASSMTRETSARPAPAPAPQFSMFEQASRLARLCKTVAIGAVDTFGNGYENFMDQIRSKKRTDMDVPLTGKVCIVTGANAGIGLATSEFLAKRGAHVILACRSKTRAQEACEALSRVSPLAGCSSPKIEVMELDLANLSSVNRFCDSFNARGLPLHLLVCNAGLMSPPKRQATSDGLEMQFQVNFLSHWLMTHKLVGEQRRRAKRRQQEAHSKHTGSTNITAEASSSSLSASSERWGLREDGVRVVMLSSLTHTAGLLNWHDMQSEQAYSPFTSYALSKLANTMTAKELQKRFDRNTGYGHATAVSVHPGVVYTGLATTFFKTQGAAFAMVPALTPLVDAAVNALSRPLLRTPENAALTVAYAALAPANQVAGGYVVPGEKVATADETADDPALVAELWQVASKLTGLSPDPSMA